MEYLIYGKLCRIISMSEDTRLSISVFLSSGDLLFRIGNKQRRKSAGNSESHSLNMNSFPKCHFRIGEQRVNYSFGPVRQRRGKSLNVTHRRRTRRRDARLETQKSLDTSQRSRRGVP